MSTHTPQRALGYVRLSDARDDAGEGIARQATTVGLDDQKARLRRRAADLGWVLDRIVVENDALGSTSASAFKRRKIELPDGRKVMRVVRPGFRECLDDLAAGRADGFLTLDLDRAMRDPRDLEDLIDVVESARPRIPVESVTGSLRLGNDSEITMARVMVAMGNKASRDTSRRVSAARERQAQVGAFGGGQRRYGFEPDGITVRPREAAEIVKAADALLAGVSLRQITLSLRDRNVPTVTGTQWATGTVADILRRPRNAGLIVYRGEIQESATAPWEPILERSTWEGVCALLADQKRRTSTGNTPRWLGSLIYRCGAPGCQGKMVVQRSQSGKPQYRCNQRGGGHANRLLAPVDKYVVGALLKWLADPSHITVTADATSATDTTALGREADALRAKIAEAGDLWEDGTLSAAEYRERRGRLQTKLDAAEAQLRAGVARSPLDGVLGAEDVAAVWAGLDLGRQRAILRECVQVTIMPETRPSGSRGFDEESVLVEWVA